MTGGRNSTGGRGRRVAGQPPLPRLADRLVLRDFLAAGFGGRLDDLMAALSGTVSGRRADGQSHFLSVLQSRAGLGVDPAELGRMDLNVMAHEAALARHRREFRLLYFQYLAAMFTELFLTRLTGDEAQLLLDLNAYREAGDYAELPAFAGRELRTLAFWLATGAGKTLLMHLALRQFEHYTGEGVSGKTLFTPDARILVTPNAGLTAQHLREFAESGIEARHHDSAPAGFAGVQVIEITKLRPDSETPKKSSVTVPVGHFAGNNLVLVDEGHKGAATASDLSEERRWRSLREALAGPGGFTLEYSATFAQVTETDGTGELLRTYARAVAFEYAYGRFYRDGYGKEFRALNLRDDADAVLTDRMMLAGLLTLLNKRLAYDAGPEAARDYHLKAPLMVFVGATVSGNRIDSDVPTVLRLLERVLGDRDWAEGEIALLLNGQSGFQDADGRDAVQGTLEGLRGRTPAGVYGDLTGRIFGGAGGLRLHHLRGAEGEIALWAGSGAAPFGVVNVGDPAKLLRELRAAGLNVGKDDPLSGSLFGTLNEPGSTVNVLVGSKKFIEGWSSWRVSVMSLLRVGQNAGAQVMQLFGRGVRLLGLHGGLQRSEVLDGSHPESVPVQETLHLFGIKANYLQVLLDALRQEGVEPTLTRELPIDILPGWETAGLRVPAPDPSHDFGNEVIALAAREVGSVSVSLSGKLEVAAGREMVQGDGGNVQTSQTRATGQRLETAWPLLSEDALLAAAHAHKGRRGWHNLFLPRAEVLALARGATLTARPDFLRPTDPAGLAALQAAAEDAMTRGIDAFYTRRQRRAESGRMTVQLLDRHHPNFPRISDAAYGYRLQVPQASLAEVELVVRDAQARLQEADTEPLPRLNFDRHLYAPLLTDHPGGVRLAVKATPKPLEASEIRFVHDLRAWWTVRHEQPEWADVELWVLRNLPKTGVGFFQTAGFYPDFLVWIKRGEAQALAFVDPKGVRQMGLGNEKFNLKKTLEGRREAFGYHVTSFIAAANLAEAPFVKDSEPSVTLEELADRHHILNQDERGEYITWLMERLGQGL